MYSELRANLVIQGEDNLDLVDQIWHDDLKHRQTISGFLKDLTLGEKRLISMPERVTSSVDIVGDKQVFRPSAITGFSEEMGDIPTWWSSWKKFMFSVPVYIRDEQLPSTYSLLQTIPRAKYPALTAAEEEASRPLQALCLALFDAALTWLLSVLAPDTWQPLRNDLHRALHVDKPARCVAILREHYAAADVVFVQEASEAFAARAGASLDHHVVRPAGADGRRRQMSLVLLRRGAFDLSTARDVTADVLARLARPCVEPGDLCAVSVASARGGRLLLASFHGDSAGRSTAPVLAALDGLARERLPGHTLLVGLDANPPAGGEAGEAGGECALAAAVAAAGLASCWGGAAGAWTTRKARTPLQPQLHKAAPRAAALAPAHARLADWLLFRPAQLAPRAVARDNTGRGHFDAGDAGVMPSRAFPSDHAVVAAAFRVRRRDAPPSPPSPPTPPALLPATIGLFAEAM
jgi:hypothetical protein